MLRHLSFQCLILIVTQTCNVLPVQADDLFKQFANQKFVQSKNVMQCMERCIRKEGRAERATCKSSCASIPSAFGKQNTQRDCMAIYKFCTESCPKKDKSCRQTCKKTLMQCS